MTKLQKFVEFAEALTGRDRENVEAALESMMRSYSDKHQLSPQQEAEIERRINDPDRALADPEEVNRILGRSIAS